MPVILSMHSSFLKGIDKANHLEHFIAPSEPLQKTCDLKTLCSGLSDCISAEYECARVSGYRNMSALESKLIFV